VVTTFWKINFKRQPNPVLGLRFKAVRTASRLNRTLPRLYRRAVTKTLGR
jgi:hypothetical protein